MFRIEAAKVLAFAKEPHGQTSYRLYTSESMKASLSITAGGSTNG